MTLDDLLMGPTKSPPKQKNEIVDASKKLIEDINYNSPHFVRYIETYFLDLTQESDKIIFRGLVCTMSSFEIDDYIRFSKDLKSAIIFKHTEYISNPDTIHKMPEQVRKLFKLGEFAEPQIEIPESNEE